jgi:energy-coupling factor transport system substrate-specific component
MHNLRTWILISFLAVGLFVAQVALASIPNVEFVSLLFILISLFLPLSATLLVSLLFTILQMLLWGMGDWVIGYLWIWPVWVLIIYAFKSINKEHADRWAILSGLWGFLFGALFAIHHGVLYGFNTMIAYYIQGISFDIIHAVSNYIITSLAFTPLSIVICRLARQYQGERYESHNKNR